MSPVALLFISLFCSLVDGAPPHLVLMGCHGFETHQGVRYFTLSKDYQWHNDHYTFSVVPYSDDDHIDMPNLIKMVKLTKNPHYDFNFSYFHLFVNCRLSLVSLRSNFIFWTHCPASSSLTSWGQCFCNITGLSIHFLLVVVVVWSIWGCVWDGVGVVLCRKAPYHTSVLREEWALCS